VAAVPEIPLSQLLEEAGAYRTRVPLEGTLETTFRCNLSCVHCYVNQPASSRDERAKELPLSRLEALVDELAAEGCLDLLLTGGEVLLRPDFPALYLHAVKAGLRVTVFTNGTLVTDRIAELFAEYHPACVEITLYGMTRETYERVTRVPGSFDRCRDGIRRLHSLGVPLKLKTMVLSWNAHEVAGMRRFAEELGVDFRHDSLLNPRVDCGANRNPELQVDPERAVALDLDDPGLRAAYERSFREAVAAGPSPSEEVYTCGAGQMGFTVDPYGRLQLCQLSRRASFDLARESFARGWHEFLPAARSRRWQSDAVCRRCSLRPVCGNCPGAAEMELGDVEARVVQFCEITHLRAHALLGEASGHRRDATCCRGRGELAGRPEADAGAAPDVGGCGSCGHAEPRLVQIEPPRRRPRPPAS
jgi:radical SAM protein with 4Fe4S-binding SPASM domain